MSPTVLMAQTWLSFTTKISVGMKSVLETLPSSSQAMLQGCDGPCHR